MSTRSPAQQAATRRWIRRHPEAFAAWVARKRASGGATRTLPPRSAHPIFVTQQRSQAQTFKIAVPRQDPLSEVDGQQRWSEIVSWIDEPGNMMAAGKLRSFCVKRKPTTLLFSFSHEDIAMRFRLRFG